MNKVAVEDISSLYLDFGYTMQQVAEELGCSVGYVFNTMKKHSIKSRDMHDIMKGRKHTDAAKEKISSAHKGKTLSKETKLKLSKANIGIYRKKTKYGGHKKIRYDGYVSVYCPNNKSANSCGYVMEHRAIMEESIGRQLCKHEVVHHINSKRSDNRIENLLVMTKKEHAAYHMNKRHQERRRKNAQ